MIVPLPALKIPGCTDEETVILQLRARGLNYRDISDATGIAPRKVHDAYKAAMRKAIDYLERQAFLGY